MIFAGPGANFLFAIVLLAKTTEPNPKLPGTLYTGTPMEDSASMSRKIVRIETSRRCARPSACRGCPR